MTSRSGGPAGQPPAAGGPADHVNNGEENTYPGYVACFTKGLPHDDNGEVEPSAYQALLRALASTRPDDFGAIPLDRSGGRRLVNPQSGLATHADGIDSSAFAVPPAPRLDSAQHSGEVAELYWMAALRDVPFERFGDTPLVAAACTELSAMSDFQGPRQNGAVTPGTLFRGNTPHELAGPFVSQFLLQDIQFGTQRHVQRQDTVQAGRDYVTTYETWLRVQRGTARGFAAGDRDRTNLRHLVTPRDLAHYVHFDADASPFLPFLNAGLILLDRRTPVEPNLPYRWLPNQDGFGTFGMPHLFDLITGISARALRATWFQKWFVHRRLRPEAVGGRVHNHLTGRRRYDFLDQGLLESQAVRQTFDRHGSYLLPQAYPEGSPLHPSYTAGHATVAGASATILKAWFDESAPFTDPVQPTEDGTALVPYTGTDAGRMTVGGEIDKLAANIANGRNIGGVHYRSDYSESVRLGEALAIEVLRRQKTWFNESHSFTLTRFNGTSITI